MPCDPIFVIYILFTTSDWLVTLPSATWMGTVGKRSHSLNWQLWQVSLTTSTLLGITMTNFPFCEVPIIRFPEWHEILGLVLKVALVIQVFGGYFIFFSRLFRLNGFRPWWSHIHQISGLLIYTGGLIHGGTTLYTLTESINIPNWHYRFGMALGFIAAIELYIFSRILHAWYTNWWNDSSAYDAIADQEAQLKLGNDGRNFQLDFDLEIQYISKLIESFDSMISRMSFRAEPTQPCPTMIKNVEKDGHN